MTTDDLGIQKKQVSFFPTVQEFFKNVDRETQEGIRLANFDCRISSIVLGCLALFTLAVGTYLAREGMASSLIDKPHDFTLLGGGLSLDLLGISLGAGVIVIIAKSYNQIKKLRLQANETRNEIVGSDQLFRDLEFADSVEIVKKFLRVAHENNLYDSFLAQVQRRYFLPQKPVIPKVLFEAIVDEPSFLKNALFQPNAFFGMHLLKGLPSTEDTCHILKAAILAQPKDTFGKMKRLFALHPICIVDLFLKENKNWRDAEQIVAVMNPDQKTIFVRALHLNLNALEPIDKTFALHLLKGIDSSTCLEYVEVFDKFLATIGHDENDENNLLWANFPENVARQLVQISQKKPAASMETDATEEEFLVTVFEKMELVQKKRFIKVLDQHKTALGKLEKTTSATILRSMDLIEYVASDYPTLLVANLFIPVEANLQDSEKELYSFHPEQAVAAFISKRQLSADSLSSVFEKMKPQRKEIFVQCLELEAKKQNLGPLFSGQLAKKILIFISPARENFSVLFEQLSPHFQAQDPDVYACYPDILLELLAFKTTSPQFVSSAYSKMPDNQKLSFLRMLDEKQSENQLAREVLGVVVYHCLAATLTHRFLRQETYPQEFIAEFLKWPEQMADILMTQGANVVYGPFFHMLWDKMEEKTRKFFIQSCLETAELNNESTSSFYAEALRNYKQSSLPPPLMMAMAYTPKKLARATKLNGYYTLQSFPEPLKAVFNLMDDAAKEQFLLEERKDNTFLFTNRITSEIALLRKSSCKQMQDHFLVAFFRRQPDLFIELIIEHRDLKKQWPFVLTFLEAIGEKSQDIILRLDAKNEFDPPACFLAMLTILSEETRWIIFDGKNKIPPASRVRLYSCFFSVPAYKVVSKTFAIGALTNFEILVDRLKTGKIIV